MIKTVIIDDDKNIREMLASLFEDYFPEITICATADSVQTGIDAIKKHQPELVTLDIELKGGTGFHILQKIKPYNFKLIFITAFNHFAMKAIKFSAMDYILKPINEIEFKTGIERVLKEIEDTEVEQQINNFFDIYEKKTQSKKIILRTANSIHITDISDIIYCKSDNSYTTFYLNEKEKIIVSKGIKEYDKLLNEYGFFRSHQSYMVNLHYVNRLDKTDGGFLILKDKTEIPVSLRRKAKLIQILETI